MAKIRNYGVGTGYSSTGITGAKSSFAYDEKVYACHVWDELAGNEQLRIVWERKEAGTFVQQVIHSWVNEGYSSAFQWGSIKNYPPGEWRANFWCRVSGPYTTYFTIKEKPAPPAETRLTINSVPSGAKIFIDGKDTGKTTSYTFTLDPGRYLIRVEKSGYKESSGYQDVIEGKTMTTTFGLTAIEVPPEKPWYIRWLDWTEEQLEENVNVNPIVVLGKLSVMFNSILPEKWQMEVREMPDWLQELGLWILFAPAFTTAAEGLVKEGATTAEANKILELLRTNGLKKALDIIKANPTKYTKAFLALDDLTKSQILKGMQKDFLAKPALKVFNDALMKEIVTGKGLARLLTVIAKPKTILWGLSGILGTIGMAYGISFGTEWFAKEGLWELYSFPLSDKMRDYRRDPTPELLEIIKRDVEKLREVVPKAQALIQGIAWLWPFTKDAWLEYADGLEFELKQIEDELAAIAPPAETARLIIRPTPTDAKVSVSGQIPTTGTFDAVLPIGFYDWTCSKFGYVSKSGREDLSIAPVTVVNVTLKAEVAPPIIKPKLIIAVIPEDAKIEVAAHPEITEPGTYSLDPGNYSIVFSKEGYESGKSTVFLGEGKTETVSMILKEIPPAAPPEEVTGKLTIVVIPEDAIIAIAGQPEITRSGTYDLPTGNIDVKVSKEGYVSQIKTAFVSEKRNTVVSFTLEEIEPPEELPSKATLYIISSPTNSDIYIDGKYAFTKTPYTTVVEAGTYIIRVQRDGFFPQEASVTAGKGDEIEIPFVFEEMPEEVKPVVKYLPSSYYYPEYEPADYYVPYTSLTPYSEVSVPDYSLLEYPSIAIPEKPYIAPPEEKEILINIETTDVKPWEGSIFSVAWLDLTTPGAEPQVIVDKDELGILKAFIEMFEMNGFTRILGFKVIFDYRFIFNKLMLYRIQSRAFFDAEMRDVKQLLDQVKEEFVYYPDKTGTLDDYGKELLGIGKYGAQEELYRRYVAGDIDYVEKFQLNQIQVTQGLYDLFRYCSSGSFISSPEAPQSTFSSPVISEYSQVPISSPQKQCPNCLAFNQADAKQCVICGQVF